jgi:hypothetical protein
MVLEELNLPYDLQLVEFADVKMHDYLEVNPNGRLPTIKDPNTGIVLWEVSRDLSLCTRSHTDIETLDCCDYSLSNRAI